jgi:membrane-associated protease RseP (regulator of RpoE activity)
MSVSIPDDVVEALLASMPKGAELEIFIRVNLLVLRYCLVPSTLVSGLWFSVPLMVILFSHELGHYLACRSHGLRATPPFFIPAPAPFFPIGTFGAVIRIKEPIRTKRQLLDVGAAGPIAGFVATLPFLAFGVAASEVTDSPIAGSYLSFGEPLAFDLVAALVRPGVDSASMLLHPTGVAAWFGLLLTLLNLLPLAQLDGGHITYALLGRWQRRLAWPLVAALAGLGFFWPGWWLWAGIAVVLRPVHPPIWDEHEPLDRRRTVVGLVALVIFVICFMLAPIEIVLDPAATGGTP